MKRLSVFFLSFLSFANIYSQSPDWLWSQSIRKFQNNDFVGALSTLDVLIDAVPNYAPAYFNRGIAKINLMDEKGACQDFTAAKMMGFKGDMKFTTYLCDDEALLKVLKKQFYPEDEVLLENNYRPAYTLKDTLRGALRPERTCFDVYYYDLTVRLFPAKKKIEGKNDIHFHVTENTNRIQLDLFDNMKIESILYDTIIIPYTRVFDAVFIDFPKELAKGTSHSIEVKYNGKPRIAPDPPWDGGLTWERDSKMKRWIGVSCERLGASVWWPNKDHLSDEPDSMFINIEVPEKLVVVSNGNLRDTFHVDKKYTRYEWFVSYPINNYNVTFYAGNFVNFSDTAVYQDRKLAVDYYVLPQSLEKAKEYFKQTVEVIEFFNEIYGPFPFWEDGFGQVESPFMGMEHQTAIAYGNAYGDEGREYRNGKYDPIIVHEAAHEWWGNAISAEDMTDAWIHESFATYSEALFMERKFDHNEYLHEIQKDFNRVMNFWPMVENRDVNENSFASGDIYMKGASMLHNLRCILNDDEQFFGLLKSLYNEFVYQEVNTQQFIDYIIDYTDQDLTAFFHKYLYEEDLPILQYRFEKKDGNIYFYYKWTEVEEGFVMPFCIKSDDGTNFRLEGTTEQQRLEIPNTSAFYFYNPRTGYEGVEKNSFTFFWTKME